MPRMCTVVTVRDPALGPVRIMTTHLEFYSRRQRMAQARALRALHAEASAHAAGPPEPSDDGSPFQTRTHTPHAILCGDFNFEAHEPEYAALVEPGDGQLWDSWRLVHGEAPRAPTFRLHDRRYGPDPVACDFVLVSESLTGRVGRIEVDGETQASDHQPVFVELT
jgi:endonuclease/exonuclease/phosphatase family metal-dependent hydrolase